MRIETATLPEFGLDVSWAMCRNPMCANFGVYFEGEFPEGRKQASDDHYLVRLVSGTRGRPVGEILCRDCGQSARLASNKAIRPIARYFLSLSLPFADCPNTECQNHGMNVYEHWASPGGAHPPLYRPKSAHRLRCRECGKWVALGTPFGISLKLSKPERDGLDPDEIVGLEKQRRRQVRRDWKTVLEAVRTQRSVTNTIELSGMGVGTYYRHLARVAARLRDYHAYRNARLLSAGIAHRDKSVGLFTDVLDISLQVARKERRHALLKVIATSMLVDKTIFVVAAHPFFLPERYCPSDVDLRPDRGRLEFEREWACLLHPGDSDPTLTTEGAEEAVPDLGRGGYFIRSPYAELAHFLVVQKLLSRSGAMHCYMDSAKEMFTAALVAYRDRILAGRPDNRARDGNRPRAEIVLFQHDKKAKFKKNTQSAAVGPRRTQAGLKKAWDAGEARFLDQEMPADLLKGKLTPKNPKVRARVFKRAFKGAYSEVGKWAWLAYPPENVAYRRPRSLWLTRMPGKSYTRHGKAVLSGSTLQPVDSLFNSVRSRTSAAGRPLLRAEGQSYRNSYVLPAVAVNELAIYLIGRNYMLRRKTSQKTIPAEAMGLVAPSAAGLDLLDRAWNFRLGIAQARRISRWRRE